MSSTLVLIGLLLSLSMAVILPEVQISKNQSNYSFMISREYDFMVNKQRRGYLILGLIAISTFFISIQTMSVPIFYKFKGGKGVATYLGTVVGYIIFLAPDLDILFWRFFFILGFVVLYFGFFYIFRISAISSLITCTVGSLYIIFQESTILITASQILIVVLIFYQHRENLSRLSKGDENKF